MSTKIEVLKILSNNTDKFFSGEEIAKELGITRAAVSRSINTLRKSGYNILSRTKVGYKLLETQEVLTDDSVRLHTNTPCKIIVETSMASTNEYLKTVDLSKEPVCVIAHQQTAGKGRLGRSFYSPDGTGLYMSIGFKPDFQLSKGMFVTMASAVKVAESIEEITDKSIRIKWVNDLFHQGKKVCGILTEAQTNLETGQIQGIIIGIGINCFTRNFPHELDQAGALSETPGQFSMAQLAGSIIDKILSIDTENDSNQLLSSYRRRCFILGKPILVRPLSDHPPIKAKAIDIDDNGGLIVEYMEGRHMREIHTLRSGEVSVIADHML